MAEVSIVIPTKNNVDILERCLRSIRELDYPRENLEVVINDGNSADGTVEIAEKYGCRVIFENKGTIGEARDAGVKHSKGKYIAFTDSDCTVERDWLYELRKHFNLDSVAAVGGPNLTPGDDTELAKCVGDVLSFLSKPGARYGYSEGRVTEIHHNPTCNVMYRKSVLEEVGGFDYSLVTVDDEELDYRIRRRGYKILYTPDAKVNHYRRPTWRKFVNMAYNYGVGRAQAVKLHRDMGRWFHFAPSLLISMILLLFALYFLSPVFPLVSLSILALGALGIALISLQLRKKRGKGFPKFFALIAIWFWGYGTGMLRGAVK